MLQVGDVAGVATTLTSGLRELTNWNVRAIDLSQPSGGGRVRKSLELPSRGFRARRAVHSAVSRHMPDVVHVHWARFAPFIGSTGRPTVIHAHGSDVRGRSKSIAGRIVQRSLDRADAVLVSTPDLIEDVGARGRYLPNPVDTRCFSPVDTSARPDDRPTVLLFSRLIDVKGAQTLLDGARLILARVPGVRVIGLGGGTYDAEAVALGVEMISRQSKAELTELLARVDVVVGQLRLGSLGLSELESMSCGKPVVAFVRPGLYPPDIPMVSAATAEQVAQECSRLLADEVAAGMLGRRARSYVVEHHDTGVVVQQLIAIYEELL